MNKDGLSGMAEYPSGTGNRLKICRHKYAYEFKSRLRYQGRVCISLKFSKKVTANDSAGHHCKKAAQCINGHSVMVSTTAFEAVGSSSSLDVRAKDRLLGFSC